jgi:hypothetical protein
MCNFFLQNDVIFYHNNIMIFILKMPISSKHMDVSIDFYFELHIIFKCSVNIYEKDETHNVITLINE